MPTCPNCGHVMTSGEECRLQRDSGHCFSCYPGGPGQYLNDLLAAEEDGDDGDDGEDWNFTPPGTPSGQLDRNT